MTIDRLRWKRRLGAVARLVLRPGSRRLVLIYHAIGSGPWAVDAARFRAQIDWLSAHARVLALDDLLRSSAEVTTDARLQVALTFDDGYACLADAVLPILAGRGMVATVYLNTGWIDEHARRVSDAALGHYPHERFLSWPDVERLAAAGWTIGSHGVEHLDLTTRSPEVVDRELIMSRREIESRLGGPCEHFSYTWGRHTPALRERVRAAGYAYAAAGVHAPLCSRDDPLAFPRVNVHQDFTLRDFEDVVRGAWDYLGWVQRTRAWRQ